MKKILMRGGVHPSVSKNVEDVLKQDFIGGNSGNLIFAHGLVRNLTTDNTIVEMDDYRAELLQPEFINENYEAFVIPLADAFRPDFEEKLKRLTAFIKKLNIPVHLVGAGLKMKFDATKEELYFPHDNTVKAFISAVLEKSNMVGLRGNITAQYLTNLGFKEGRDHMAIGCPSMYTYGENLKIRPVEVTENMFISTNRSKPAPKNVLRYINGLHKTYTNTSFIPQGLDEFKLLYSGRPSFVIPDYPSKITDIGYADGNSKFFVNATDWIEHLRKKDFSFGTKLHGNITATIAGTPSITIPIDARMRELVEFHNLTSLTPSQINESDSLNDLIEKVDLQSAEKVQKQNYKNFIEFIANNKLEYTYQDENNFNNTPYDKLTVDNKVTPGISGIVGCDIDEITQRVQLIADVKEYREVIYVERQNRLSKALTENKQQIIKKDKKMAVLEKDNNEKDIIIKFLSDEFKSK